jgi:hypothetical protein
MRIGRRALPAAAAVVLALTVTACGEESVAEDELESEVKTLIAQEVKAEPKEVDCPGDLKAEEGEKMRCKLVPATGEEVTAEVTVTSVEDEKANFSVEVVE